MNPPSYNFLLTLSHQKVLFTNQQECVQHYLVLVKSFFHLLWFPQVEEVKKMKIGDPLDRSVAHGPQNHK